MGNIESLLEAEISVSLHSEAVDALKKEARRRRLTPAKLAALAIAQYLEDQQDIRLAKTAKRASSGRTVDFAEVMRRNGLGA